MVVPEFEKIVVLSPGDIMTFRADKLWHACITDPDHGGSKPASIVMSMYFNRRQFEKFKSEAGAGRKP